MVHSTTSRRKSIPRSKFEMSDNEEFISRIKKTLYYGKLPRSQSFSLPVSELAAEFFTEVKHDHSIQSLDLAEAASFSRKASVSPCSLVLALLYVDRLKSRDPEYIKRVAPSELFVVSMMVASKFLNDDGEEGEVFNDKWAVLAGVDTKEMNRSERDFLQAIGWEVFVNGESFWKRLSQLERNIALREGKKRGWFSYTDLDILMEQMDLARIAHTLISVSAVCLTSYTASVLTLLGSALIVGHIPSPTSVTLSSPAEILSVPPHIDLENPLSGNSSMFDLPLFAFLSSSVILNSIESFNQTDSIWAEADIHGFEDDINGLARNVTHKSLLQIGGNQDCPQCIGRNWSDKINLTNKWMPWKMQKTDDSVEVSCTVLSSNR